MKEFLNFPLFEKGQAFCDETVLGFTEYFKQHLHRKSRNKSECIAEWGKWRENLALNNTGTI
jgi:hypothetical protein